MDIIFLVILTWLCQRIKNDKEWCGAFWASLFIFTFFKALVIIPIWGFHRGTDGDWQVSGDPMPQLISGFVAFLIVAFLWKYAARRQRDPRTPPLHHPIAAWKYWREHAGDIEEPTE
jgi:hypothetical protein